MKQVKLISVLYSNKNLVLLHIAILFGNILIAFRVILCFDIVRRNIFPDEL